MWRGGKQSLIVAQFSAYQDDAEQLLQLVSSVEEEGGGSVSDLLGGLRRAGEKKGLSRWKAGGSCGHPEDV